MIKELKKEYYQRLPHIQPIGAIFFVTFRLYESIPRKKTTQLKQYYQKKSKEIKTINDKHLRNRKLFALRNEYFQDYNILLDKIDSGPVYLENDSIAKIVSEQIHRFDGDFYDLIAYSIMNNHVHLLIDTSLQLPDRIEEIELIENYIALDQILKRIKGPSAIYSNRELGLSGQFWARESFDTYVRNDKMLKNIISYILENPVKAGIVNTWKEYKWNYLKK